MSASDAIRALQLQEAAEEAHVNCAECDGEEVPELCPKCFPLYDNARIVRRAVLRSASLPSPVTETGGRGEGKPEAIRAAAADAIRTFCQSLGAGAVVVSSDGVERIYQPGISLDALSVAVALALGSPSQLPSTMRRGPCQCCREVADLFCGPSRFGPETWACADCWDGPVPRPERGAHDPA